MPSERWRWVDGYEGLYMVSDHGRVIRTPKSTKPDGAVMSQNIGRGGYATVKLCKDGIQKRLSVHRLVAIAFIENDGGYSQVNHKDGNKLNNSVENLEWVTPSENMRHSVLVLGNMPPTGTPRFTKRKLTDEQADEIRMSSESQATLAKRYEVSQRVIWCIKAGKTYNERRPICHR